MSGGSYNWMYNNHDEELFSYDYKRDLDEMVDKLVELGYQDAAREAEELLLTIKQAETRAEVMHNRLSDIFKAIEWAEDGDSTPARIEQAIKEYREVDKDE